MPGADQVVLGATGAVQQQQRRAAVTRRRDEPVDVAGRGPWETRVSKRAAACRTELRAASAS